MGWFKVQRSESGELREAKCRAALHGVRDDGVEGGPGVHDFGGERTTETFGHRVEQGLAHRVVVPVFNSVTGVTTAQRFETGHEREGLFQQGDRGAQHLHELLALLLDIRAEERAQRRIEREEPLVENKGDHLGARFDEREGLADELDLVRSHGGVEGWEVETGESERTATIDAAVC